MRQLTTKWGRNMDVEKIHQEYPRPQLARESYVNLNGEWKYTICKGTSMEKLENLERAGEYDGKIIVPFSPETFLSGVQRTLMPEDTLHYEKRFVLPDDFSKDRILLHFGAVDQECKVWLNEKLLGEHKGGYLPFTFDVTGIIEEKKENNLEVSVIDQTEKSPHARGKQKLVKKGKYGSLFYTPNSGIWKTVWLESVAREYITDIRVTPQFDDSEVEFIITTNGQEEMAHMSITKDGTLLQEVEVAVNRPVKVHLDTFEAWTPDTPELYDVEILYGKDRVTTYFGMRKLSVEKDSHGILRFFLNNKPYFFNGLLDQGYWPESLLTAPSDEALKYDILKLKELGYNTIRKHIKVEPERFYYHCDKIGMMVWQDMPNGGGDYNMVFVTYLPNASNLFARGIKDHLYSIFKRKDEEGRRQYYEDLEGMVKFLYNHPSIAVWVPFNEGWGQFDARKATALIGKNDTTRFVNEACGWFDQQGGDMYSIHNYTHKLVTKPQKDRVVALTEYGGYSYPVKEHMACEKEFGYQAYTNSHDLTANYKRLWEEEIYPNLERGLSSAIYTQTSDIEEEINGLMTYDREINKMEEQVIKELNWKLYEIFEKITS